MLQNKSQQAVYDVDTVRLIQQTESQVRDTVAVETPVALVINGEPHVVMMATPEDLEDFAIGFCITENLVSAASEIDYLDITPCDSGLQIHIRYSDNDNKHQAAKQRNLTGRTGCGLCGTALIEDAVRNTPVIEAQLTISQGDIFRAKTQLEINQPVKSKTGAVHAAAWISASGELKYTCEDVGRHNALDKLVGRIYSENSVNPGTGFFFITSRASYEMVTKTAFAGVPVLVAISAPTSLAIEIAEKSRITLIGFARDESCVIYTHPQRIVRTEK